MLRVGAVPHQLDDMIDVHGRQVRAAVIYPGFVVPPRVSLHVDSEGTDGGQGVENGIVGVGLQLLEATDGDECRRLCARFGPVVGHLAVLRRLAADARLVRICPLSRHPRLLDVVEGKLGDRAPAPACPAAVVGIGRAGDQLLRRQDHQLFGGNCNVGLQRLGACKRPATNFVFA